LARDGGHGLDYAFDRSGIRNAYPKLKIAVNVKFHLGEMITMCCSALDNISLWEIVAEKHEHHRETQWFAGVGHDGQPHRLKAAVDSGRDPVVRIRTIRTKVANCR